MVKDQVPTPRRLLRMARKLFQNRNIWIFKFFRIFCIPPPTGVSGIHALSHVLSGPRSAYAKSLSPTIRRNNISGRGITSNPEQPEPWSMDSWQRGVFSTNKKLQNANLQNESPSCPKCWWRKSSRHLFGASVPGANKCKICGFITFPFQGLRGGLRFVRCSN